MEENRKKKIVVISSSARKHGNSDLLADAFIEGIQEKHPDADVEKFRLLGKNIKPCLGCNVCQQPGKECVQKDDFKEIADALQKADIVALATPVYFYGMSGQLKTLLDRTYSIYRDCKDQDYYFLISCAGPEEKYGDTTKASLEGYLSCLPNGHEKETIVAYGTYDKDDVKNHPAFEEAKKAGKEAL